MGLSLSVLVALALLMPGAAFVFGLSRLHSPTSPTTILDQHLSVGLLLAVLATLAAHGVTMWLVGMLGGWLHFPATDPAQVFALLAGDVSGPHGLNALASLHDYPIRIATYFIVLTAASWALGKSLNGRLRKRKNASWYELLRPENASFVVITADLQLNGECFLFSGVVKEFSIAKCGNLERVVLAFAARKPLSKAGIAADPVDPADPKNLGHGWLEIPGEFVVLQMKDARTINLDYFFEGDGDDEDDDSSESAAPDEPQPRPSTSPSPSTAAAP